MSETLPTLNVAYPQIDPWFDLRQYLVNGWASVGPQTCGISAQHNLLFWSIRINGDDATSRTFAEGVPGHLRSTQNMPIPGSSPRGGVVALVYRSSGRMLITAESLATTGSTRLDGEFVISGVTPRGTAVS